MSRKRLQWLRVISVVGPIVLCSACNKVPGRDNPPDVPRDVTHITRDTARSQASAKTVRAPAKRMAHSETVGAAPVRGPEDHEAVVSKEVVVPAPIDIPPPNNSITELARAVATFSAGGGCGPNADRAFVLLRNTDAFMKADASSMRLATIGAGVRVKGVAGEGEWRLVRF